MFILPNPKTSNNLSSTYIDLLRHFYVVGIVGQIGFSFFEHRDKFFSLKLDMKARWFCLRLTVYFHTSFFWFLCNAARRRALDKTA